MDNEPTPAVEQTDLLAALHRSFLRAHPDGDHGPAHIGRGGYDPTTNQPDRWEREPATVTDGRAADEFYGRG